MNWQKAIRRTIVALVGVAVLGFAAVAAGSYVGDRKAHRRIGVSVQPLPYVSDANSLERGRYLFMSRGCAECHGADGAGREFVNDGKGLRLKGPNITPGPGGVVAAYRPEDWVRTIRHGIKPNGEPLMVMPSEDYNRPTDEDLAALVAHVRALPPANGEGAVIEFPAMVMALYGVGLIKDAAEKIDHSLPPSRPVAAAQTVEHGAYVANMCLGCHGQDLSGGKIPGGPPDWPPAADLRGKDSAMDRYADAEQFKAMLRTGKRPDGSEVSKVMRTAADGTTSLVAEAPRKWIAQVAAGPQGSVAYAYGKTTHVRLADGTTKEFTEERTVEGLAFAPKGLRVAAARYNGVSLHWVGTSGQPRTVRPSSAAISSIRARVLATCSASPGRKAVPTAYERAAGSSKSTTSRKKRCRAVARVR